jgi:hypothetical protein
MLHPLARVARAANLGRACPCNEGVAPMALIPHELYRDDRERKEAPISETCPPITSAIMTRWMSPESESPGTLQDCCFGAEGTLSEWCGRVDRLAEAACRRPSGLSGPPIMTSCLVSNAACTHPSDSFHPLPAAKVAGP